jgi:hypothetical protein
MPELREFKCSLTKFGKKEDDLVTGESSSINCMKWEEMSVQSGYGRFYVIFIETQVKYGVRSPKFIWAPVYSCTYS